MDGTVGAIKNGVKWRVSEWAKLFLPHYLF